MGFLEYSKDFAVYGSILSLIGIGLAIALRSGVVTVGGDRCRVVLGNLSHLILGVTACIIFLLMLQQMVGVKFVLR